MLVLAIQVYFVKFFSLHTITKFCNAVKHISISSIVEMCIQRKTNINLRQDLFLFFCEDQMQQSYLRS